jgi:hypothetical protein
LIFGSSKHYCYRMSEEKLTLRGRVRNGILSFVVREGTTHANVVAGLYQELCGNVPYDNNQHPDAALVWARVHLHQLKKMGLVSSSERKRPSGTVGRGRYVEWKATPLGESVVQ